jgi:hypothetical protein
MKLIDTRPIATTSGIDTPGPVGEKAPTPPSFTEMEPLQRDIELLLMVASLSEITEGLEERLQTLELTTTV